MSGSTVHDLFLDDLFARAPYHLLEHRSAVKPILSSRNRPIKQQDGFPCRTTCVTGMLFFFFSFFKIFFFTMSVMLFFSAFRVMTLHIPVAFLLGHDQCATIPTICGRGKCTPVQTGYTCQCEPGFKLSALQTNCIGKLQWEPEGDKGVQMGVMGGGAHRHTC